MENSSHNEQPRVILAATSLHQGDAEQYLVQMAYLCRDLGYQVHILTIKSRGVLGKKLLREGFKLNDYVFGRTFISKIPYEFYNAELVIALDDGYVLHSLASLRNVRAPRLKAPPYIVLYTSNEKPQKRQWYPLRRAKKVVYIAKSQRPYLRQNFPGNKIEYLPYSIDTGIKPTTKAEARLRLGISDDVKVIAGVGHFIHLKGYDLLLKAFSIAVSEVPDARLYLAGDGPQRRNLGQQSVTLGVADKVYFLGVMDDASDLYAAADVFVVPSRLETVPLSCLYAMSFGLPVVGFRVGDVTMLLSEGRGVTADPVSSRDMANRLISVLANPDEMLRMGNSAREYIRSEFNQTVTEESFRSIIRKTMR